MNEKEKLPKENSCTNHSCELCKEALRVFEENKNNENNPIIDKNGNKTYATFLQPHYPH